MPRENCPPKTIPHKCAPRKIAPRKYTPHENYPPWHLPPPSLEKLLYIIIRLFLLKLFIVTSFRGVSRTPATSIKDLLVTVVNASNKCHKKNFCLDVAGVIDPPLSLLGEVFQRYLAVWHIAQPVTHYKTVIIACLIENNCR